MKLKKIDILKALEKISAPGEGQNLVESGAVTNVQVFGDEVEVDVTIKNPSLQAKKKTEVEILKCIHREVYEKAKIKVNLKVDAPAQPKVNQIKGNPIPGIQNIIAVASGKGGVGKSTVTANIAVTLAKMGFKVGLLDTDIYGPSMPIMFDVATEKPLSINVDGKAKMKPIENYGVKLLSIGFFTQPNQAVIWRGPMAAKALNQMIFDAHWGELDFLLLDLPPEQGLRRRRQDCDQWNRLDAYQLPFHSRVRQGFLALARDEPDRWEVIDANQNSEDIFDSVRVLVDRLQSSLCG